jgi:hypothetical protein
MGTHIADGTVSKPGAAPPSSLEMKAQPVAEGAVKGAKEADGSEGSDIFWTGYTADLPPCCLLFGCIPLYWPVRSTCSRHAV